MESSLSAPSGPTSPFDGLAEALSRSIPQRLREKEWAAGYGVLGVDFESGDLLALRRFPYGTIGAYSSIWHRSADGVWRMYFDAPRADLACPRYFSDALFDTERASISLDWHGSDVLEVRATRRHLVDLRWRVGLGSSVRTGLVNTVSKLMPARLASTPQALTAAARGADLLLGMGGFAATGRAPNGQQFSIQPHWIAPIVSSSATLDGRDLGALVMRRRVTALGDFIVPRRPIFAVGCAFFDAPAPAVVARPPAIEDDDQGELLSKYVCQRLVSRVMEASHRGTFGGERTVAAVLFIDICGFTALSERCEPERVMQILNRNLEIVVDTIFRYDGAVLKFLGDGVLAAFGVHRKRDDDVQRAAMAALEIQANVQAAQAAVPEDERVDVSSGLHYGPVVCGNIGHRERLDFTIIG
ncbi:MAG TPA: adenylate/guanylate cyclase domain-containing protein, partial [Dehalococcoidia bacterium]